VAETIDQALLTLLRGEIGADIEFSVAPAPLTGGYDAAIYSFALTGPDLINAPSEYGEPLVLRMMQLPEHGRRARREAATHLAATSQGYPAPRVLLWSDRAEPLGRPFLIMQRLPGENLMKDFFGPGDILGRILRLSPTLAEAHVRLHRLDPLALQAALGEAGLDPQIYTLDGELQRLASVVPEDAPPEAHAAVDWLRQHRPQRRGGDVICHGDFHPLNLVDDGSRRPGVVDWANAIVAEPEYDAGATIILLRYGPAKFPPALMPLVAALRGWLVRRYLAAYRRQLPLDPSRLRYFQAYRIASALAFDGAMVRREGSPWDEPTTRALCRRFGQITGVPLRLV
jgi:aminoglycoside phosphotransferase (APT) family kinase protein